MRDLHLHVWPHRPGTPPPTLAQLERYCEAAAARGIEQIAITEHSHRFTRIIDEVLPHWERPTEGPVAEATAHVIDVEGGADLDTYVQVLATAQDRGLPLLIGLEVDHLPGAMPAMAGVLDEYPFDVLLGSVHWLDDWLFDAYGTEAFALRWEQRDIGAVYRQYVDSILDLSRSGVVDVLAHVDVIKVAGHRPPDLVEHEQRLADGVAESNMVVEFSSAGLRKPAAETYPSLRLLDALLQQGVAITTASDGHTVDQIGLGFDQLRAALDERGVTELVTFNRREPVRYRR